MGSRGLEPPTLRLSGVRSNHLSYRPNLQLQCSVQPGDAAADAACAAVFRGPLGAPARRDAVVEPIGIEPMTS